jgi:hypothetical protein
MDKKIFNLIEESYDKEQAKVASQFKLSKDAIEILIKASKDVLVKISDKPGACAHMSALLAGFVQNDTDYPIHVVAGSFSIDGYTYFRNDKSSDSINTGFKSFNLDWDGHCWIMLGDYVGDISIFRTAYLGYDNRLRDTIISRFGEGKGFLFDTINNLKGKGLVYNPRYVLKYDEITGLLKGIDTFCK